jgi:CopG family nickel-responsive transcriptional regulator
MMKVRRFGVSLEEDLLEKLDRLSARHKFPNRSQAIRFLIRSALVEEARSEDREVAGVIVIIYDHHKRGVVNRLLDIQHDYTDNIVSSQHIHLDHSNCLETIVLKGRASRLQRLADRLMAIKGIKHGRLVVSGTE